MSGERYVSIVLGAVFRVRVPPEMTQVRLTLKHASCHFVIRNWPSGLLQSLHHIFSQFFMFGCRPRGLYCCSGVDVSAASVFVRSCCARVVAACGGVEASAELGLVWL